MAKVITQMRRDEVVVRWYNGGDTLTLAQTAQSTETVTALDIKAIVWSGNVSITRNSIPIWNTLNTAGVVDFKHLGISQDEQRTQNIVVTCSGGSHLLLKLTKERSA